MFEYEKEVIRSTYNTVVKKKDNKTNRGRQYNTKKGINIYQPLSTAGELCDSEW